ncbi:hypothetical protein B4U79_18473 [Dinothrombium tinctorium]|uniref:SF3 helicase domain-containing protein n=1 Tax=Dinothrombium tinctorium TaxID=1965070 RepID=A0A443QHW8_9ACAR|nr:hypothetical protein B4U79_18473 [Dinothrombium tinctorium]
MHIMKKSIEKDFYCSNNNEFTCIDLEQLYRGIKRIVEIFESIKRIGFLVNVLFDIFFLGNRKKVLFFFSPQSNHGKTTFLKSIEKLSGNDYATISYASMSSENENDSKQPALVEAAGKKIILVDEVACGCNNLESERGSTLSAYKIRMITGNISTRGVRRLNENSENLHFDASIVFSSNIFPMIRGNYGEAEISRFFYFLFPKLFKPNGNSIELSKIITEMSYALKVLLLCKQFGFSDVVKKLNNKKQRIKEFFHLEPNMGEDFKIGDEFYSINNTIVNKYIASMITKNNKYNIDLDVLQENFSFFVFKKYNEKMKDMPILHKLLEQTYKQRFTEKVLNDFIKI